MKLAGNRVNNNKQVKMTAKNPRSNKSFQSTAQSTRQQQQRGYQDEGDFVRDEESRNMTKSQIMNKAWDNPDVTN